MTSVAAARGGINDEENNNNNNIEGIYEAAASSSSFSGYSSSYSFPISASSLVMTSDVATRGGGDYDDNNECVSEALALLLMSLYLSLL